MYFIHSLCILLSCSDPYCRILYRENNLVVDGRARTRTIKKTLNPEWNEEFFFGVRYYRSFTRVERLRKPKIVWKREKLNCICFSVHWNIMVWILTLYNRGRHTFSLTGRNPRSILVRGPDILKIYLRLWPQKSKRLSILTSSAWSELVSTILKVICVEWEIIIGIMIL